MIRFKEPPFFILLLLVSFGSVAALLFISALPEIAQVFVFSKSIVQSTLALFLVGFALGNLIYGPLSNRYGRKWALYVGVWLVLTGCLIILSAGQLQRFDLFIIGRFILGLGSSVGMKIVYAILADVYQEKVARKKFSSLGISFFLGPAFAIGVGGVLASNFGWESCFYLLMAYCFVILFFSFFLLETSPIRSKGAINWEKIRSDYLKQLTDKRLVLCALIMGMTTAIIYVFFTEAPFIASARIGFSPEDFGVWGLCPPFGVLIGSILSRRLAGVKDVFSIVLLGIRVALGMSIGMFFLFLLNVVNVWTLFVPMLIIMPTIPLIFLNISGFIMAHHDRNEADPSSVLNFINYLSAAMVVFLLEMLPTEHPYLMPLIFVGSCALMYIFRFYLVFHHKKVLSN